MLNSLMEIEKFLVTILVQYDIMAFFRWLTIILFFVEGVSSDIALKSVKVISSDNNIVEISNSKWTENKFNITIDFKKPIEKFLVKY